MFDLISTISLVFVFLGGLFTILAWLVKEERVVIDEPYILKIHARSSYCVALGPHDRSSLITINLKRISDKGIVLAIKSIAYNRHEEPKTIRYYSKLTSSSKISVKIPSYTRYMLCFNNTINRDIHVDAQLKIVEINRPFLWLLDDGIRILIVGSILLVIRIFIL